MARANTFNKRAENNRNRVRKYRYSQKLKAIHEKKIYEGMYSKTIDTEILLNSSLPNDNCIKHCDDKVSEIKSKIIKWVLDHRIAKFLVANLLKILNFAGLTFLPKDSRTLLHTPVAVPIKNLTNGQLWYNGIEQSMKNIFAGLDRDVSITLDFNFDGLPIFKSSNKQLWPILSSICGKNISIE